MKTKQWTYILLAFPLVLSLGLWGYQKWNNYSTDYVRTLEENFSAGSSFKIGQKIDSLNGIYVYYNGLISYNEGKNSASDGYDFGSKYQCVEFIKRYYYYHLNHKIPNNFEKAIDFYDASLKDKDYNSDSDLIQYENPSKTKPEINDIIIFNITTNNKFGHLAIISKVTDKNIEIIQQDPGPYRLSRERIVLEFKDNQWLLKDGRVLGLLRKNKI